MAALPIRILVVGGGAVGAFYGSRLALAGQQEQHGPVQVDVVCRGNHSAVLAAGGRYTLSTRSYGTYSWQPHAVYASCAEAAAAAGHRPYDYILLTTKALPDRVDMGTELVGLLSERTGIHAERDGHRNPTTLVLLQNGVGIEAPYAARFPHVPILTAVTVFSGEQRAPAHIVQHRWTRISLGPYDPDVVHPVPGRDGISPGTEQRPPVRGEQEVRTLVALLRSGGISDAEYYAPRDMQLLRWHKLSINATLSPLAILSGGLGVAEVLALPALRELARQCMHEVHATAVALHGGRPFPPAWAGVEAILASSGRNAGKPSMLLDWEAGRPLELAVILRNPIALAQEQGLSMPRIHTLLCLLEGLLQRRQQQQPAKF